MTADDIGRLAYIVLIGVAVSGWLFADLRTRADAALTEASTLDAQAERALGSAICASNRYCSHVLNAGVEHRLQRERA